MILTIQQDRFSHILGIAPGYDIDLDKYEHQFVRLQRVVDHLDNENYLLGTSSDHAVVDPFDSDRSWGEVEHLGQDDSSSENGHIQCAVTKRVVSYYVIFASI